MNGLFASIWSGYDNTLVQGQLQNVSAGLSAVAGVIQAVLGLYVLITGGRMLFGELSFAAGMRAVARALLVAALLVPANYNAWIVQTFTGTLPAWIAQSLGQGGTTAAGAQQFDQLRESVVNMAATLRAQVGMVDFGAQINITAAAVFSDVCLLACFAIWFLAQVATVLVVSVGPFLVSFWLFNATKGVSERWIGKLIDYTILTLLVLVVLKIVQVQDAAYMRQAAPMHGGNVLEQIDVFWNVALTFGVGAFMLILLPALAATLGGGLGFSTSPIVGLMFRLPGSIIRK